MGDGALVEFASVVDAVQCAAAIQHRMAERDQGTAQARQIRFRIGVSLGNVILDGSDIYGDEVNIARRLEAMAEPGGICISGTAFDHAVHKVDVGFACLGERRLKNIADPIRVYRILLTPGESGKVVAAPRRLGPRIAILAGIAALMIWKPRESTCAVGLGLLFVRLACRDGVFTEIDGGCQHESPGVFRLLMLSTDIRCSCRSVVTAARMNNTS